MDRAALAIVEIHFSSGIPHETETREIEDRLRKANHVDNLAIHNDKIIFYIWGDPNVDYGILDTIKAALKSQGFSKFTIASTEYARTAKAYFYKEN